MEQVEGGDLLVNKGNTTSIKTGGSGKRDMNFVEGLETATKLAKVIFTTTCNALPRH